jgi:hypothetical protein
MNASAIREATRLVELLGKLTGELHDHAQTNVTQVNFVGDPHWPAIRQLVHDVLSPYPEAQERFRQGLRALSPGMRDTKDPL